MKVSDIITESVVRQWKRSGNTVQQKFRCMTGAKEGKLVTKPSDCNKRKDPKKVRQGRQVMRTKKSVIAHKGNMTKRTSLSKMVAKMNKRLMGN